jgi:hypothetical protein
MLARVLLIARKVSVQRLPGPYAENALSLLFCVHDVIPDG